jgi:CheY-like chemotaxis protein
MRILVADDDPIVRRVTSASVQSLGHEVVAVADGNDAWAALSSAERPSLALLDWNMPGLDGPSRAGPTSMSSS